MTKLWFDVVNKDGSKLTNGFGFTDTCLFGWAGRDREEVMKHAKELEEHGVPGPTEFPTHFIVPPCVNSQNPQKVYVGDMTCGEIEFFFFIREGVTYVGVGSEHTDRRLEAYDFTKSKAVCEKMMSSEVWKYEDVKDHWDQIQLTAWQINEKGEKVLYQDSPLAALLTLEDLKKEAQALYGNLEGVMIWSGTIPTVNGLVYGSRFEGKMEDKVLGRKMEFAYDIKII